MKPTHTLRRRRLPFAAVSFAIACAVACATGCDNADKQSAAALTGGDPDRGARLINQYGCGGCHTIPGVRAADGVAAPPLTRMASRSYVGGVIKNTPANLVQWIQNPPGVDPMTAMPNLGVTEPDARDIAGYLYTLR